MVQTQQMKEIQQINLQMAKYFVSFCEAHGLTCYFCGGGCIGAIRDQGFIPWDDDLDFFMPREDYEKLAQIWQQEHSDSRYVLLRASQTYNDHNSFTTIRDRETTFIKTYQADLDIPHGIAIDIFPLDGAPDSKFARKMQKMWALVYALFCSQVVPKAKHGKLKVWLSRCLLRLFSSAKSRYRIWSFAEKQMRKYPFEKAKYVTELCVGPKYMGNIYCKEDFASAIWVSFEDTNMPIPVGYDRYLRQVFGDYMTLPPKEAQVSHHDSVWIDPQHSYQIYKYQYYLSKK